MVDPLPVVVITSLFASTHFRSVPISFHRILWLLPLMGVTFSRLGLLLLPAVAIQSHVKEKKVNKNWVEPEVGHYESHSPTGVGSFPSAKLDIWFDEELQSREFNLTLGEYSGRGHLRPVGRRGLVALTGVDGSQEDGYLLDQCSKLTKLTQKFFEAIDVYKIPRAERSRLIILCPVPGQGWTLYLGLVRDSALTFKALYSPVVLTSPSPVPVTLAQAHKKRDLREWALPPSGVYRSDGTMRVGDLTHLKLIIDSNRVVIALGDFTAWGLLERQAQIQRVPLSMGDGMKDTHPSAGSVSKFKYSAEGSVSAVNAAYRHYRIPDADASSGHKSMNLCPVADAMRGSPSVDDLLLCAARWPVKRSSSVLSHAATVRQLSTNAGLC
ncbi:hypothetical protein FOZ60_007911 [Perkinsus olseni]|uniref:Uncharacterized protein n=1 Tax=Perkinsus olseni TaxID=32597 RepID=A0A7J6NKI8_PEROL|nr:hypothetical protein FOZ60_007911 [Perkinsus olseni]